VGVVYVDLRAGRHNLYFQRLDASGAPAGGEVALTAFVPNPGGGVKVADIVWTGTDWGVVWFQEARISGSWTTQMVLQRITEDGALGPAVVVPAADEGPDGTMAESFVALHTPTAGFALLYRYYTAFSSLNSLRFRILGDGSAPAPAVQIVTNADIADAVVGPAGTFGVVYTLSSSVYFRRVEADGSIVSAPVLLSSSSARSPAIAHDGGDYVFAWTDTFRPDTSSPFERRVMIARGTATAARSAAVTSPTSGDTQFRHPRLTVQDGVALLTWQTTGSAGARMDHRRFTVGVAGAPLAIEPLSSVQPLPVIADQRHDIVWTGASTAVLAWADTRWSATEIYDMGLTLSACEEP
jgi:hypothetical protein